MRNLPRRELPGGLTLLEATTRRQRGRGLARVDEEALAPDEGLLLRPCRSIHTIGMRFALDLVWLDADERVVRVDPAVPPNRLRTCLRARAVVEAHAGRGAAFADALNDERPPEGGRSHIT